MFLSLPGTPHGNAAAQMESTNAHVLKSGLQFSPSARIASERRDRRGTSVTAGDCSCERSETFECVR